MSTSHKYTFYISNCPYTQIRLNIHMNVLDDDILIFHHPPDFFSLSAARFACKQKNVQISKHFQELILNISFTCISAFFWEADLPAFSCCLVFLGALPAASASFFFWLFDLGGILSLDFYLKMCFEICFRPRIWVF